MSVTGSASGAGSCVVTLSSGRTGADFVTAFEVVWPAVVTLRGALVSVSLAVRVKSLDGSLSMKFLTHPNGSVSVTSSFAVRASTHGKPGALCSGVVGVGHVYVTVSRT